MSAGEPVHAIASVASFFVSRVDAKADALLRADSGLRGREAIANAHGAYGRYGDRFADERWRALETQARAPSGRWGRAPEPRIPPTRTSSTTRS